MATTTVTKLPVAQSQGDASTEGLLNNLSTQATKTTDQIAQDQLAGIDQNKSFAPDKDQVEREAAAAGGPANTALSEALGRKKQKIYGQELEQLKAQAGYDATGKQLSAQERANQALRQNAQVRHRQAVNDYRTALNKKKQENGILMSALQFGGAVLGGAVGMAFGGPQGAQMGAQAGGALGGTVGGLGTGGNTEQEGLQ